MGRPRIVLVKLGGAVITNKDIPESVRRNTLKRLIKEIVLARKEKNLTILLGNGAGSFAHVPAARYKTKEGFISTESRMGMAITQDSAARLNRVVVRSCLTRGMPAVTLAPSSVFVTKKGELAHFFPKVLEQYLASGLVPVVYGDVIADLVQGCTIWSTDRIFTFLARELESKGWEIDQMIHVTEAHGVWKTGQEEKNKEEDREIYATITPANIDEVRASMVNIKGFDVTGGMWHKIEESLSLADLGIETRIISGLVPGALYDTLMGDKNIGTRIAKI